MNDESESIKEQIGLRISVARKAARISQNDLAIACGVHRQTVSKWERGLYSPNSDELVRIAKATGSSPNFLLGFSDAVIYKPHNED